MSGKKVRKEYESNSYTNKTGENQIYAKEENNSGRPVSASGIV
jgi:hypothetical protein